MIWRYENLLGVAVGVEEAGNGMCFELSADYTRLVWENSLVAHYNLFTFLVFNACYALIEFIKNI